MSISSSSNQPWTMNQSAMKAPLAASNQGSLSSNVHLKGQEGLVYLPLCAKPSFLELLNQHNGLLEEHICHALDTQEEDILIFIADGEVMEEAIRAIKPSKSQAVAAVSAASTSLHAKVDAAMANVASTRSTHRIKGVVHWHDVEASCQFQAARIQMETIMGMDLAQPTSVSPTVMDGLEQIQFHVKTLVKNLYTQRITGTNLTNIFTGDGLAMLDGAKYLKRYKHLERSCLLELCFIMVGMESGGQTFTEMLYFTLAMCLVLELGCTAYNEIIKLW